MGGLGRFLSPATLWQTLQVGLVKASFLIASTTNAIKITMRFYPDSFAGMAGHMVQFWPISRHQWVGFPEEHFKRDSLFFFPPFPHVIFFLALDQNE